MAKFSIEGYAGYYKRLKGVSRDRLLNAFSNGGSINYYNGSYIVNSKPQQVSAEYKRDADHVLKLIEEGYRVSDTKALRECVCDDFFVSSVVLFDPDVLYNIIENDSNFNYAERLLSIKLGSCFDEDSEVKVFRDFCPSLITDYKFINLGSISNDLLSRKLRDLYEYGSAIHLIYTANDSDQACMRDIVSNKRVESSHIIDGFIDDILDVVSVPIKRCYIISRDTKLSGRIIGRVCKDGEYVVTIC